MRIATTLALSALATSALAQTTVYSNAAPRATSSIVTGSDVGAPSLRYWGSSATDGISLFNFGGRLVNSAGTAGSTYYNGLDAYNPVTNTWTNLSLEGEPAAPGNRFRAGMAYDPVGNRLVIFGGSAAPGLASSDCYEYSLSTNTWNQIPNPTPGVSGPSDRFDAQMAFDAATNSIILFGGDGPASGAGDRLNDTWLLSGNSWVQLSPVSSPSPRALFAMTSRSAPYGDVFLFGGFTSTGQRVNDSWRWDGALADWVQITPINSTVPVSFGGGNVAVYDSARQVVSMINGTGTNVAPSTLTGAGSWTSEYDCVTNEWRAYGDNLTNQSASDPLIGRQQRFCAAYLNGATYFWGGQNVPSTGDANLPFVKEYQASPLASATSYGAGCNGQSGSLLTLTADGAPWTGRTWSATCTNLGTTTFALPVFGFATSSLALDGLLPGLGVAGCTLLNTADAILSPALPVAGSAQITLPIAFDPVLAGVTLHAQVAELDISFAGLWASNGVTLSIGAL